MNEKTTSSLAVIALALTIPACATAPQESYSDSLATVRAAEAVGAAEEPNASYHLELAKKQLAAAKPLIDGSNKDKKLAAKVITRAKTDAELALQLAKTADVKAEANEVWADVRALEQNNK